MFKRVISYAILPMDEPSNQKQPDLNIGLPPDMPASDSNNSADMETKTNGSVETKNIPENGQLPDPSEWAVNDVVDYIKAAGFEEQATAFEDQEIDGKSLLLMTRNDVLTGLCIRLGPALKIYEYHVKPLQTQHLKSNAEAISTSDT
ncbi:sterile alpha motif domain-containing protein 13-like [Engraulis encrasicolus]|uniref:sterile alpha motif domain-containing protein 13-like n=1 Tax=Engraulis encrasicolus TaxID=184585 RepID=UPI002FD318D4